MNNKNKCIKTKNNYETVLNKKEQQHRVIRTLKYLFFLISYIICEVLKYEMQADCVKLKPPLLNPVTVKKNVYTQRVNIMRQHKRYNGPINFKDLINT